MKNCKLYTYHYRAIHLRGHQYLYTTKWVWITQYQSNADDPLSRPRISSNFDSTGSEFLKMYKIKNLTLKLVMPRIPAEWTSTVEFNANFYIIIKYFIEFNAQNGENS